MVTPTAVFVLTLQVFIYQLFIQVFIYTVNFKFLLFQKKTLFWELFQKRFTGGICDLARRNPVAPYNYTSKLHPQEKICSQTCVTAEKKQKNVKKKQYTPTS
jgi:hypothetical protein